MADVKLMDVVQVLAEDIGPRPTGTEEEQRAATAIQQWLQNDAGLNAAIEEVDGDPELETTQTICFGVAFLVTFLAFIVKALALPAIVLSLAAAAIVVLEELGIPILTRFLRKGISQNVVAVYEPERITTEDEAPQRGRARKVVLIARYDSARVRAETNGGLARVAWLSNFIETCALIATPFVMLVHYLFFMYDDSVAGTIFSGLTVVLLALMGLHLVKALGRRLAKYNDAANCNATGVAVLVDLAQRINGASLAFKPRAGRKARAEGVRHGAAAAEAAGVVPEGAELHYDVEETEGEDDGFAADGMDEILGGRSGLTWGAGLGAAAVGAGAAAAGERGSVAPEDDADVATTTPSWRGRATATRGFATVDSNLEITSRPLGAAPGSGFEGGYTPSTPSADLPQTATPAGDSRTVRAELNDVDYMGNNPRLEAARAAVRAQRAAAEAATTGSLNRESISSRLSSGTSGTGAASAARTYSVGSTAGSTLTPTGASAPYEPIDFVAAAAALEAATRGETASSPAETPAPAPEPEPEPVVPSIPDWFTRGKAASQRTASSSAAANVTRSRFNDALRGAEALAATVAAEPEPAPEPSNVLDAAADFMPTEPRTTEEPASLPVGGVIAPVVSTRPRVTAYAIPQEDAAPVAPVATAPAAPAAEAVAASAAVTGPISPEVTADITASMRPVAVAAASVSAAFAAPMVPNLPAIEAPEAAAPAPVAETPAAITAPAAPVLTPASAVPAPQPTTGFAAALAAAQQAEERQIAEGKIAPGTNAKLSVLLPDISASAAMKPISSDDLQQRAPLAQATTSGKDAAKSLLTLLPSISLENPADVADAAPAAEAAEAAPAIPAAAAVASGSARTIGGMTAAFASVGDELASGADADDIFVDDADDSAFRQNFTSTGAFAGPGYVDMPKGRKGFLGRLFGGKKKRDEEMSTREWLHVDEDFDARTVGAARGGWESFREDSDYNRELQYDDFGADQGGYAEDGYQSGYGYNGYNGYDGYDGYGADGFEGDDFNADDVADDGAPTRNWNGGAFSLKNLGRGRKAAEEAAEPASGRRSRRSRHTQGAFDDLAGNIDDPFADDGFEGYGDGSDGYGNGYDDPYGDPYADAPADNYSYAEAPADAYTDAPAAEDDAEYGAYRRTLGAGDLFAEDDAPRRPSTMADFAMAPMTDDDKDLQEIFDFRDGNITAEVWFVALGSESPNNSGMKAFLDAHGSELKNAVFIELEGMGAGDLCLTTSEGRFRRLPVAGRMRRYVQKAQQALGLKVGSCTYNIDNSATYTAMMRGMQAMHLVGVDGAKPAYQHQADDVVEVVDPEKLAQNADFVMEVIRSI